MVRWWRGLTHNPLKVTFTGSNLVRITKYVLKVLYSRAFFMTFYKITLKILSQIKILKVYLVASLLLFGIICRFFLLLLLIQIWLYVFKVSNWAISVGIAVIAQIYKGFLYSIKLLGLSLAIQLWGAHKKFLETDFWFLSPRTQ